MNASIILQGRSPNILRAISEGNEVAASQGNHQYQNALRTMLATNGSGIAKADPKALDQYAKFDPAAAQGIRANEERLNLARAAGRRAAAAAARDKTERAKLALEIQNMRQGALAYSQAREGDAAAYEAWSAANENISFDQFPVYLATAEGGAEMLKNMGAGIEFDAPPEPVDNIPTSVRALQYRAQLAGYEEDSPEYRAFMASGGEVPESETIMGPDGQPILIRTSGGVQGDQAAPPPKMTVDAAKNAGFLIRARDAGAVIDQLEDQGTRFWQQNLDAAPLGLGNYARDPEFQQFDQARRDFVNAVLRRESGAVISDQEFDNAEKQYFPQPGDSDQVIAQKRQNRQNAIMGFFVGAGKGGQYVVDNIPVNEVQQAPPQTHNFDAMSLEDLEIVDVDKLTPDQMRSMLSRYNALGY